MFSFFKKRQAMRAGYPYSLQEFWPPLYLNFGGEAPNDAKVFRDVYHANVGDVIPVFSAEGKVARYRLDRITSAAGSDHIVSPLQFDLTFVSVNRAEVSAISQDNQHD
ncbi:hypothetical protein ABE527_02650 [Brucella sp. TWI432]